MIQTPNSASRPPLADLKGAMRHFAITLCYDGTKYGGWQIQKNSTAIQEIVTKAVSSATGEQVSIMGSGRTDAGVHAMGQVAGFSVSNWRAPAVRLIPAINRFLPRSIVVRDCREAISRFDPIRSAKGKRYRYSIRTSKVPDPMHHLYHWWHPRPLNIDWMNEAAKFLIGTHDFKSFETLGSPRKTSVRTVRELVISSRPAMNGHDVHIEIEADGFLYNMVRNIAGALSEVGIGRFSPRWIAEVLEKRVRDSSSQTAPALGLCLMHVEYPESLFLPAEVQHQ